MGTQHISLSTSKRPRSASFRWLAVIGLLLALLPALTPSARAADQATLNITSLADDGSTPLPFARFQVIDSNDTLITTRESTPPDGAVSIVLDLTDPELTYTVTMETPPACGIQPDDQVVGPLLAGDVVDLTFETGFEAGCTLGSISLYAYSCPAGLDLTVDDYAQYRDNCFETQNGEPFTIAEAEDGGQEFSLTTGEYGIDGRAPLVGLFPGNYTAIHDGADPDTTLVYCQTYDGTPIDAPVESEVSRSPLNDDGQIELTLAEASRIACDFFTVSEPLPGTDSGADQPSEDTPADESPSDQNPGDVSAAADTASIEFHVATCAPGYDGSDYFADCSDDGTDNVTFTVVGQNTGYTDNATSNVPVTPGFGIAIIENLPADTFTMSEDVPGDFVSLWVYCADSPGGGPRIPSPENGSQEYDIDLAEGQAVICDWFITPDQQFVPAILRLTKFTCAPGYGGSTFADFTSDCTEPTDGVAFNLSNGSGYAQDETTHNEGRVRYTDLAPGSDYLLTEDLPGDALDNRVAFCATDGADYIEYGVAEDGSIDLDPINEDDAIQCLWYNVPVDQSVGTGSLEIHKSECPPGTSSNFYAVCHENAVSGIGFEIDGPGSYANSGTTNDAGHLTFTDLPSGDFTVSEIAPADYSVSVYVVHCTRDGAAFPTTYDDGTGLRVTFDLPAGANVICDWYNVPEGQVTPAPGGGTITVIKRLCTEKLEDIDNLREECALFGAGAGFKLSGVNSGVSQTGKTGTDSRLVFTGLANGAYSLQETTGDWCKAEADHVDARGNVLVQNGGNTNVYIYNCGAKSVDTLPGTGSGPDDGSFPFLGWVLALLAAILLTGGMAVRPRLAQVVARHR